MAFTSIGCISASPVFATQAWPAGLKVLGPVALPDKFRGGMLLIDLTQVTDLLANITIAVQISLDGINFISAGGAAIDLPTSGYTLPAGVLLDNTGNPVRILGFPLRFPQSILTTRQVQGVAVLSQPAVVGCTLVIW